LDGLDIEPRAVFVLHEVEELELSEVAAELDISLSTAKWRLRQARAHFDAALRRRRAEDLRKYGAGALILPLPADALLRLVRALPPPKVSPEVVERVLARIKRQIAL